MADRFPLILNTNANQIQEIASGDSLDLTGTNIANAGIITAGNVIIGAATTDLIVNGDARITGILTIGTSSLKLDGPNNLVNVGTALTLGHTQGLQFHTQNLHSAGFEVNQINVSGASTIGGNLDANGDLDVDGHTNLDNVSIVGVTTTTENINIDADNKRLQIGDDQDLKLYHDGNHSYIDNDTGHLTVTASQINLNNQDNSENCATLTGNGAVNLFYNGNQKFQTTSSGVTITGDGTFTGNVSIGGTLTYEDVTNIDSVGIITARAGINLTGGDITLGDSVGPHKLKFGAGADFQLFHNGSNNYIDVAGNGHLYIRPKANFYIQDYTNGEVWIDGTLNGGVKLYNNGIKKFETDGNGITVQGNINMATDDVLYLGVGNDFRLFHNGTTNYIRTTNGNIVFDNGSGVANAVFRPGGASELYHNGTKMLETTSIGLTISGDVKIIDNENLRLGTDNDMLLYHTSSHGYIENGTGNMYIRGGGGQILMRANSSEDAVVIKPDGSVELYYDGTKHFETISAGLNFVGSNVDQLQWQKSNNLLKFRDGTKAVFGEGDDLQIHGGEGGTGAVINSANGDLFFRHGSEEQLILRDDGAVELYHNNTKRLETFDNNPFVGVSVTNDLVLNGAGDTAIRWAVGGNAGSNFKWGMYYAHSDGHLRIFDNVNNRAVAVWKNSGEIELNYAASKRFETNSGGCKSSFAGANTFTIGSTNASGVYLVLDGDSNGDGTGSDYCSIQHGTDGDLSIHCDNPNGDSQFELYTGSGSTIAIVAEAAGEVQLYHNGNQKLNTTSSGAAVTGSLGVGAASNPSHHYNQGIHVHAAGTGAVLHLTDSTSGSGASDGFDVLSHQGSAYLWQRENANMIFGTNANSRWLIYGSNGHFVPDANNTYDIGTSSNRVRNIYTNDLNLSNEGGANDVDNTWGDYTIQEGESDLFLINNRSGKKYKFNLTEVS